MARDFSYEELFERNLGVFTKEEQEKIKSTKIAIAGCGGMGGSVAYSLARLGVGSLNLADPEVFEASNINRQFGAYVDTVGINKATAVGEELKRINPNINLKVWTEPLTEKNIPEFLEGTDCLMDGMEFFELGDELALHQEAVKNGIWTFMLQGVNNITTFLSFDPSGVTFEEMFTVNGRVDLGLIIKKMFPILPNGATPEMINEIMNKFKNNESIHFSSYSVLAPMGGTFIVEEFIKTLITGKGPTEVAPNIFSLNLEDMSIKHFDEKGEIIR